MDYLSAPPPTPIAHRQDSEILLQAAIYSNPEGAIHCIIAKSYSLRLLDSDCHPSHFRTSCKPPLWLLSVPV